ncbi:DUF417 family protein, partial [Mycolicibacterium goodii]|uniref:DUF417 family protein n=1 Tax=Mycolicibacterium goodii TaxID=134601 RepID=UPI001BDC8DCA
MIGPSDIQIILGKVRPLSRPLTEAHPQVLIIAPWIGMLKFTEYEANGIAPFVSNSPFMSWLYDIFSITTFSSLLG